MHPSFQYFFLTILVLSLFHATVFFIFPLKLFVLGPERSKSVAQISTGVNANKCLYVRVTPKVIFIIFQTESRIQENFSQPKCCLGKSQEF